MGYKYVGEMSAPLQYIPSSKVYNKRLSPILSICRPPGIILLSPLIFILSLNLLRKLYLVGYQQFLLLRPIQDWATNSLTIGNRDGRLFEAGREEKKPDY